MAGPDKDTLYALWRAARPPFYIATLVPLCLGWILAARAVRPGAAVAVAARSMRLAGYPGCGAERAFLCASHAACTCCQRGLAFFGRIRAPDPENISDLRLLPACCRLAGPGAVQVMGNLLFAKARQWYSRIFFFLAYRRRIEKKFFYGKQKTRGGHCHSAFFVAANHAYFAVIRE